MSILLHGDCLEHMKSLEDNSVDFIFCDLPYGQTSCKWDIIVPWEPFWEEIMRIKKLNTPVFFTTTTKFGVQLINSAPKKMPFRWDLVWVKSAPAGFLSAKKMPMRKHEMVYAFYEKLPFYDLSSHQHKFIKAVPTKRAGKDGVDNIGMTKNRSKSGMETQNKYTPPLPTSVIKEVVRDSTYGEIPTHDLKIKGNTGVPRYDPPLPTSVVKEELCKYDVNKNAYGGGKEGRIKISKNKEDHQQKYEPPLPTSVVKEEANTIDTLYQNNLEVPDYVNKRNKETGMSAYNPPLPTSMLEIKSTRGKHSTEKPVALMEWLMKYFSKEGDVVLDPTMGSGSTGVACKNMNRNFIGIEKDAEIYEVAVSRIEN